MRTFEVTIPDCDAVFVCNRVSYRDFKRLVRIVAEVSANGAIDKKTDLIDEALSICIASPDKDTLDGMIEFNQTMQLISEALKGAKVNNEERKKSE